MTRSSPPPDIEIPSPDPMIVVISGPSGVGKTVICDRLVKDDPTLAHSISATTRPRRSHEEEGKDYFFLEEADFRRDIEKGRFLEWAEVFGNLYGTPRRAVDDQMARRICPLLNVDVQGGRSVKSLRPAAVLVFVVPPSMEVLKQRLRGRDTDLPEVVARRLQEAMVEMESWIHYDFVVVNDVLDEAVASVQGILGAERSRVGRRHPPEKGSSPV